MSTKISSHKTTKRPTKKYMDWSVHFAKIPVLPEPYKECGQLVQELAAETGCKPGTVRKAIQHERIRRHERESGVRVKKHGNQLLTDRQESRFIDLMWARTSLGMRVTTKIMMFLLKEAIPELTFEPKKPFVKKLVKRYSHVGSFKRPLRVDMGRILPFADDQAEQFILSLGAKMEEQGVTPDRLYNCDESIIDTVVKPNYDAVFTPTQTRMVLETPDSTKGTWMSFLPFVSATGEVLRVDFVAAASKIDQGTLSHFDKLKFANRGTLSSTRLSPSGWFRGSNFLDSLRAFVRDAMEKHKNQRVFLLLDNLRTHTSDKIASVLEGSNVELVYFPPKMTHILQPLDCYILANFKAFLRGNVSELEAEEITPAMIVELCLNDALDRSLTKKIIQASFEDCGIYPLSPAVARKKAKPYTKNVTSNPQNAPSNEALLLYLSEAYDKAEELLPKTTRYSEEYQLLYSEIVAKRKAYDELIEKIKTLSADLRHAKKRREETRSTDTLESNLYGLIDGHINNRLKLLSNCALCDSLKTGDDVINPELLCTKCYGSPMCLRCSATQRFQNHKTNCTGWNWRGKFTKSSLASFGDACGVMGDDIDDFVEERLAKKFAML